MKGWETIERIEYYERALTRKEFRAVEVYLARKYLNRWQRFKLWLRWWLR